MTAPGTAAARQLVAAARSLRELIDRESEAVEAAGTMTAPVYEALEERGLFRLQVPAAYGGHEAHPAVTIEVCEELSYADGSVGWAFTQNTTVGSYVAYLDRDHGEPFAALRTGAGMFAPMGQAHRVDGGYRVSGSYQFGSGSGHAEFIGGSALEYVDGELAPMTDSGRPPVVGFLIPIDSAELRGNWDVMGLQGTGSYDIEVPEQFVPHGATWRPFHAGAADVKVGGAVHGLGSIVIGIIGSAAWAIGVGRRALDEIRGIALGGRARFGGTPLKDQQAFQAGLGRHTMRLDAAKLLIVRDYTRAVDVIAADGTDAEVESALRATKAASNHATEVAKAACTWAWESSGSVGMRNPSTLQRCFRDIYVGAGHAVFDERNYVELAKEQLDLDPARY